ncbi:cyclodehydratase [Tsukamurella sp. 8F]|uniref:cyclodehydratase n=1 Tax=unclassified Tsukamurella TaxID=2633480 RepID=UPI0023B9BA3B|nr:MULTISPECIES: cyclodehydratase [unclassified Tsukamurella]MDF0528885.1 cyclodehydratase [Tsukamurella sp. 8J]MDF0586720.1 cyclodehydratase [Tsukamurella sp. 8F]
MQTTGSRVRLDPYATIVVRPPGVVQIGTGAGGAPLVTMPPWLAPETAAGLLRWLQTDRGFAELSHRARDAGFAESDTSDLVAALDGAGVLTWTRPASPLRARIQGRGPITDALATELDRRREVRVAVVGDAAAPPVPDQADLLLLTDALVVDPVLVQQLMAARMPHLPVRLRDGAGVVGPLVLPGASPCLRCLDRSRTDRDPAWPAIVCQLYGRAGRASTTTLGMTVAVAAAEIDRIVAARYEMTTDEGAWQPPEDVGSGGSPASLGCTLEVDAHRLRVATRRWAMHPGCGCGSTPTSG